jgi:fido (protein-threonine AMPylation protein)
LKGAYKIRENNPTRGDGTMVLYCPPEHVASEMDNLIGAYNELVEEEVHPLIVATWFHHAFTTIHPFQDGNGRVARLITSLIFIKYGFFPFTVLREDAKVRYIESLEKADNGQPQSLVDYFGEVQKKNIQKALNVREVAGTSLEEVQKIFARKVENYHLKREEEHQKLLSINRMEVFEYCKVVLNRLKDQMDVQLNGGVKIAMGSCSFNNQSRQHYFYPQIVEYAKKHDYFFNRTLPKSWLTYRIELSENNKYQLGITIHHYGYDDTTLAIGSFLEFKSSKADEGRDTTLPLDIPPHVISIDEDISTKKKNIASYIENAMTLALAQIASEIN